MSDLTRIEFASEQSLSGGAAFQEAKMRQGRLLPKLRLALGIVGLVVAASCIPEPAAAQIYYYQCPPGYAYRAGYGCLPLSYFYGPPTYVYPNYGFGFFYGPRIGRGFHPRHPGGRGGHAPGRGGHPGHR
jgi:hypothetical protein